MNPAADTTTGARNLAAVGATTLPTTLPAKGTTAIVYGYRGYTGTIPTEFGLLTKVTTMTLMQNDLTGAIPTQLGQLVQVSYGFVLWSNSLSSAIPTQLGQLDQITSNFNLHSNSLSSAIPTQLGLLSEMISAFYLLSNKLSSTIPTGESGYRHRVSSATPQHNTYHQSTPANSHVHALRWHPLTHPPTHPRTHATTIRAGPAVKDVLVSLGVLSLFEQGASPPPHTQLTTSAFDFRSRSPSAH